MDPSGNSILAIIFGIIGAIASAVTAVVGAIVGAAIATAKMAIGAIAAIGRAVSQFATRQVPGTVKGPG